MSRGITSENIISQFPAVLSRDSKVNAVALSIAKELVDLYNSGDTVNLYARIDRMDNELLDILAVDFQIDWWNGEYTVSEKRETLKRCWKVHRAIGTPSAIGTAISAIYNKAEVKEWWEYNGKPYHYEVVIDTGETIADIEKMLSVIERIKIYANLRSRLEIIYLDTQKTVQPVRGTALQQTSIISLKAQDFEISDTILVDEENTPLCDELGNILTL